MSVQSRRTYPYFNLYNISETSLKYSLTDPTSEGNFSSTFRTIKVADFRYLSKAEVGFNLKSPGQGDRDCIPKIKIHALN